jgi:hypothetical protein
MVQASVEVLSHVGPAFRREFDRRGSFTGFSLGMQSHTWNS